MSERATIGTWQRTLNDFFEVSPGLYLPGFILVGISLLLFLYRLLKSANWRSFPLLTFEFTLANFLLIGLHFLTTPLSALIGQTYLFFNPRANLGEQSWPFVLMDLLLVILYLISQAKGTLVMQFGNEE